MSATPDLTPDAGPVACPHPQASGTADRTVRLGTAVRVEVAKLVAQRPARALLTLAVIGPVLLVAALRLQAGLPKDTLLGRQVRESGLAPSLLLLGFAGQWLLPLLVALVGGDIVAGEDRHGTWPTVLTRSCSRVTLLWAKVLVTAGWVLAVVLALAVSSLLAGLALVGTGPLLSLSGEPIPPGHGVLLVLAAWASVLPPALAFAALAVLAGAVTRSTALAVGVPVVLALVMVLLLLVPGLGPARHLLLASSFSSWHGLLTDPTRLWPLVRGSLVALAWAGVCLPVAFTVLRGRDEPGG